MQPRSLLVLIAVTSGVAGLVEPHLPHAGAPMNEVGLVQGLVTACLLFAWCKAHARVHAIEPPTGSTLLVAFVAPIGIPYYAFSGFGLRAGLRLIVKASGMGLACAAIYVACYTGSAWLGGRF